MNQMMMKMENFLHQHPLKPIEENYSGGGEVLVCNGCKEEVLSLGEAYYCDECQFFLHRSCAEDYPKTLQHFFHKCPLTLEISTTYICDACDKHPTDLTYHCQQCDFYMDVKCANPTSSPTLQKDSIEHFCHYHQLKLYEKIGIYGKVCQVCGGNRSSPFYGCRPCGFYIHKKCMDVLPRAIDHPIHDCKLLLYTFAPRSCVVCSKNYYGLTFRCGHCQLDLCVSCAMELREDCSIFKSIYHNHLLKLCKPGYDDRAHCEICAKRCSNTAYFCNICDLWFHEPCASLPTEIVHPYHPDHRLTMRISASRRVKCSICRNEVLAYVDGDVSRAYYCNECEFQADILCAFSIAWIKYDGHDHFLAVIENMPMEGICYACGRSCLGAVIFRCVQCNDFFLHLRCGPLPKTIKHKCHVHPLILEEFEVEDYGTGMLSCHVCEGDRNPRLCAYRCASGCEMICDIGCAKSEIISILQGKQGDVNLTSLISNIPGQVVSQQTAMEVAAASHKLHAKEKPRYFFIDLVYKICNLQYNDEQDNFGRGSVEELDASEDENEGEDVDRYRNYIQGDENRNFCYEEECKVVVCGHHEEDSFAYRWDGANDGEENPYRNDEEVMSRYSKEALINYMQELDSADILINQTISFISRYNGFVVKGDYFLPQSLISFIPLFEDFFAKHNVLDARSKDKKKKNSHCIFILCCVLHNMYMSKVVDLKEERISQWLSCLKLLQGVGFRVGFLIDQTKRIARASFLIRGRRSIDGACFKLKREAEQLSKKMARLSEALEIAKQDLEETLVRKDHIRSHAVAATKTMRKPYEEALRAKWKPAINGL